MKMFPFGIASVIVIVAVKIRRRRTMSFFVLSFMLVYVWVVFKIGCLQNFKS